MQISNNTSNTEEYGFSTSNKKETSNETNSFQKDLDKVNTEKEPTEAEKKEATDKLVEDIMSLFKTGLTVEEFEKLQELIRQLKDKLKEEGATEDMDDIISQIENAIAALQKRITGQAVIKADKDIQGNDKSLDGASQETLALNTRLENAREALNELVLGNVKKGVTSVNTQEELELLYRLTQNKK